MFGYASDETDELMPMPIMLAHRLTKALAERRKGGDLKWLRPDGKSQVTVVYEDGQPVAAATVVIRTQTPESRNNTRPHQAVISDENDATTPKDTPPTKTTHHPKHPRPS